MASVNLVTQLGAKIDSLAKTQNANYKMLAWVIGVIGGAITVVITIAMFVLER